MLNIDIKHYVELCWSVQITEPMLNAIKHHYSLLCWLIPCYDQTSNPQTTQLEIKPHHRQHNYRPQNKPQKCHQIVNVKSVSTVTTGYIQIMIPQSIALVFYHRVVVQRHFISNPPNLKSDFYVHEVLSLLRYRDSKMVRGL